MYVPSRSILTIFLNPHVLQVEEFLGEAAFSTAIQCKDLASENEKDPDSVCLKIIKNNKDYFDQSLDEIKLLHYINSRGDPEKFHVLRMIDYFYFKEHLFLVTNQHQISFQFHCRRLLALFSFCFFLLSFSHYVSILFIFRAGDRVVEGQFVRIFAVHSPQRV
jgi:hypothetical protein